MFIPLKKQKHLYIKKFHHIVYIEKQFQDFQYKIPYFKLSSFVIKYISVNNFSLL